MSEQQFSRVYLDRPAYADYESPEKFQAIIGIIMTRLRQHPNAICSYSGGSDSDIMLAWNIFGASYRYRQKYNQYKRLRMYQEEMIPGQMSIFDYIGGDTA